MTTELGSGKDNGKGQHHGCNRIGVRCGGFVRLAGNKRGENSAERNEQTKRERLVGCEGQVGPLIVDQEDGGPTIPAACGGERTTAPFVFRIGGSIAFSERATRLLASRTAMLQITGWTRRSAATQG